MMATVIRIQPQTVEHRHCAQYAATRYRKRQTQWETHTVWRAEHRTPMAQALCPKRCRTKRMFSTRSLRWHRRSIVSTFLCRNVWRHLWWKKLHLRCFVMFVLKSASVKECLGRYFPASSHGMIKTQSRASTAASPCTCAPWCIDAVTGNRNGTLFIVTVETLWLTLASVLTSWTGPGALCRHGGSNAAFHISPSTGRLRYFGEYPASLWNRWINIAK